MIASAVPGEGKTLTATNLALTLSESYQRRVLLIDADLRRPSLHEVFQARHARSGLSDGLLDRRRPSDARAAAGVAAARRSCRPAGRARDPMGGLTSDRMRRLLEEARAVVRLGDHRHAAGGAAARRAPAGLDGRRRRAGRAAPGTTPHDAGQARGRRDRPRAHPRRRAEPRRGSGAGTTATTSTTATTRARRGTDIDRS